MDSTKRGLIVDDSKLSWMIIRKVITENFIDWVVSEAIDAASALELAQQQQQQQQQQFNFITLDYNMPGQTGYDVYPQLRASQQDAQIAIITANIQAAIKTKFQDLGAIFHTKPEMLLEFFAVEA